MGEKQALNGAYYGPSIPPKRDYHRHGRGRGCGCGRCLLCFLLQLIGTLIVIIGLAVLVFWLVVRPQKVKFHVTDATLSEFNVAGDNSLKYDLKLNVTVRNPNKRIGIYFDKVEARALYQGERIDSKLLDTLYLGNRKSAFFNTSFKGQHVGGLSGVALSQYKNEKTKEVFTINFKLYLRIRMKIGAVKIGHFKPRVSCNLFLPINGTGGPSPDTRIGESCSVRYY